MASPRRLPGNSGNPNPNPDTRFKEGNAGGRAGRKNRRTIGKEYVAKEGLTEEEKPLAFFLNMMMGKPLTLQEVDRETGKVLERIHYPTLEDRKWGAGLAAPYLHAKLANIELSGNVGVTHESWLEQLVDEDQEDIATRH